MVVDFDVDRAVGQPARAVNEEISKDTIEKCFRLKKPVEGFRSQQARERVVEKIAGLLVRLELCAEVAAKPRGVVAIKQIDPTLRFAAVE